MVRGVGRQRQGLTHMQSGTVATSTPWWPIAPRALAEAEAIAGMGRPPRSSASPASWSRARPRHHPPAPRSPRPAHRGGAAAHRPAGAGPGVARRGAPHRMGERDRTPRRPTGACRHRGDQDRRLRVSNPIGFTGSHLELRSSMPSPPWSTSGRCNRSPRAGARPDGRHRRAVRRGDLSGPWRGRRRRRGVHRRRRRHDRRGAGAPWRHRRHEDAQPRRSCVHQGRGGAFQPAVFSCRGVEDAATCRNRSPVPTSTKRSRLTRPSGCAASA